MTKKLRSPYFELLAVFKRCYFGAQWLSGRVLYSKDVTLPNFLGSAMAQW